MAKWEAEFNQMMNDRRNMDFDYDTMGMGQWDDQSSSLHQVAFDHEGIPLLGEYEFGSSLSFTCSQRTGLRYENREKQPIFGRHAWKDTP